ncbi:radical SAM/SPASM domain-containing protein [Methanospirillum stamsii]|uniref:Radical SAM core domain-containing protein n=1 Tax=Methanospirillum stamsii TaxID=1277351 RepID=A0A2V2MZI0_9EURY|nr:radical SAM protein [Methanospirillum stamsii]PWR71745.1 hypothetical protein DLD82_13410 [Methanospirillum stamsii]
MKQTEFCIPDMTIPPEGILPAPLKADIILTGHCNLSCQYCYISDVNKRKDLPTEQWLDFFDELGSLCVQRVTLSGGEVFLRSDLFLLIDGIIKNKMRYSILSNGTLISEKIIQELSKNKRKIRLDSIQISIDGSCADIHNRSRPGSFDKSIEGLIRLKDAGFPVKVRVTVNRYNIHDLSNVARFLLDDIGVNFISIMETAVIGSARRNEQDIALSFDELANVILIARELEIKYKERIKFNGNIKKFLRITDNSNGKESKDNSSNFKPGYHSCCGAGFSHLTVLNDGTMVPCDRLSYMIIGVIGKHPIKDIWLKSPSLNSIRILTYFPLSLLPDCDGCKYMQYCDGGCPGILSENEGRIFGVDSFSCFKNFKQIVDNSNPFKDNYGKNVQ